MNHRVYPGEASPLGASWDGKGVNFAVFAENATGVDLCLFETPESTNEYARIKLEERDQDVWHAYIPGLGPQQLYGYRVHGNFNPTEGDRFNYNKLLIDPYAKAIAGVINWHDSLFGYELGHADRDLSFN